MNSINPCRGWLWSVKRIKGLSVREGGAGSLCWKRLPGRPSSFSTGDAPRGNTRPRREISSRPSRTGMCMMCVHFLLITWIEREKHGERKSEDFLKMQMKWCVRHVYTKRDVSFSATLNWQKKLSKLVGLVIKFIDGG